MSEPVFLEFVIFQGATFSRTLQFAHGVRLSKPLDSGVTTPQTSISVYPLTCALSSGFVLSYPLGGGLSVDLTLNGNASIGDKTIAIQPYTGKSKLAYQSVAQGVPEDLTGQTWRGQIRKTAADTAIMAALPMTITTADGLVAIELSATATAALPPNAEYSELSAGAYSSDPYALDIESEIAGKVQKRAYGNVHVIREVTR